MSGELNPRCRVENQYSPYGLPLDLNLELVDKIELEYPITTNPLEPLIAAVSIVNPEFGDIDSFETLRIIRYTRGKTLKTFKDPIWFSFRKLSFKFSDISPQNKIEIEYFIFMSLGQEIKLVDFYSKAWRGFITNPSTVFTEEARNKRNITIEFEGVLL